MRRPDLTFPLAVARSARVIHGKKNPFLSLLLGMVLVGNSQLVAGSGIDIVIEGNPVLQDLQGMEGLVAVNSLAITSNAALTDLDGLKNLERVEGALEVKTNDSLIDCAALAPVLGWPDGEDQDVGSATISGNPANCSSEAEILSNVLGPTPPVITNHSFTAIPGSAGDNFDMALDFAPAVAQEPIFQVTGHRATCTSDALASEPYVAAALVDLTPVSRTLEIPGSASGAASSFVAEIEVGVDITHTDPVDLLVTLKNPDSVPTVLWDQTSPNSENLVGTFPTTLSPAEPLTGVARERMGGVWTLIVEDVGIGPIIRGGTLNSWSLRVSEESIVDGAVAPPITIQGVGQRASYGCTLTALSRLGATPVSAVYSLSVPGVPARPIIQTTDYEDGAISLYANVGDDGGSPVTGFTAACRSGASTVIASGSAPRITVSGLTNGEAYVCSVTATNALGTSVASALTFPISPELEEVSNGFPIWLLFQATQ
jgi:subtilisin-like proprotein convertase family protein